jgi:hypothetical protein
VKVTCTTCHRQDVSCGIAGEARTLRSGHDSGDRLAGQCLELGGLAYTCAEQVSVVLRLARGIRRGSNGEGVRLPDAKAGETQIEVLSRQPSFVLEVEVETDADVLF